MEAANIRRLVKYFPRVYIKIHCEHNLISCGMVLILVIWSKSIYVPITNYHARIVQIRHHSPADNWLLTHWGWVTHIYVSKLTIIGSDNGLSPGRRQAIIWTNAGILLIWRLGTNFSGISIDVHTFSLKKIHFKMSSGKWRPFCLGLNVLILKWILDFMS